MKEILKKSKRIHDEFYLKEKFVVKQSFKFLLENIKRNYNNDFSLIDIGCATGVFITYVKEQLPKVKISGADILQSLLERAKKNCPSADFYEVDVYNKWVNFNFPSNYTKLNRLRRKENYYKNNNLKYINISFSANHKSGIFSTREMEEKYREETWYVPELDKWDVGKRLRLEHTTMIGEVVKNIATLPV